MKRISAKLSWEARQMIRDTGAFVPSWLERLNYKVLPSEALKKHRERVYKAQAEARERAA